MWITKPYKVHGQILNNKDPATVTEIVSKCHNGLEIGGSNPAASICKLISFVKVDGQEQDWSWLCRLPPCTKNCTWETAAIQSCLVLINNHRYVVLIWIRHRQLQFARIVEPCAQIPLTSWHHWLVQYSRRRRTIWMYVR